MAYLTGPNISSAGGALLLRQTDSKLNLLPRLAACFTDRRNRRYVYRSVEETLAQWVYVLALGNADLLMTRQRQNSLFGPKTAPPRLGKVSAGRTETGLLEIRANVLELRPKRF